MPARLKEDHDNAKYMAEKLAVIPGVSCDPSQVEINMAFFSIDKPAAVRDNLQAAMREKGIKISPEDQGKFRFVTNNDVSRQDIDQAMAALAECLQ